MTATSTADIPRSRRRQGRVLPRFATLLLGAAVLLPVGGAPAAGATPAFTVNAVLGTKCASGRGPASAPITLTIREANGVNVETTSTTVDGNGYWSTCFPSLGLITGGRRIRIEGGGKARTVTIPVLTSFGDRVKDRISGAAPAGGTVRVRLFRCLILLRCTETFERTAVRKPSGAWAVRHAAAFDARGLDRSYMTWRSPKNDLFSLRGFYPAFIARVGSGDVSGIYRPERTITIVLRAGIGEPPTASVSVDTDAFPSFTATLPSGTISDGYYVEADFAIDASMRIPEILAFWVAGTRRMGGHCLPNLPVTLDWPENPGDPIGGTAGVDGWYRTTLRASTPGPASSATITVSCQSVRGDVAVLVAP